MGGRGFESRQKRPKLKDENICILGDASFSHKKSIPDQKGARSSASISRVCPGRVGADPGTHQPTPTSPRQPQKALDRARRQMNTKNNGKTQKHHHHHSARSRPAQFCLESHPGIRWSGEHRTITAEERKHGPNEPHGDPIF